MTNSDAGKLKVGDAFTVCPAGTIHTVTGLTTYVKAAGMHPTPIDDCYKMCTISVGDYVKHVRTDITGKVMAIHDGCAFVACDDVHYAYHLRDLTLCKPVTLREFSPGVVHFDYQNGEYRNRLYAMFLTDEALEAEGHVVDDTWRLSGTMVIHGQHYGNVLGRK